MIAIIYTGFNRYYNITENNHKKLKARLKKLGGFKEYWFTKPNESRPFCIYDQHDARGAIQVFDLLWALDNVEERVFIKLRTDVWLSDQAVDLIVEEVKHILEEKQDMTFLGWYFWDWDFNSPGTKTQINSLGRVEDFVVIADKTRMPSKDEIFNKMNARTIEKLYTGNKIIRDIMTDSSRSYTIKSHIYLVRSDNPNQSEYDIALEYMKSYGGKGKSHAYRDWFIANRQSTKNNLV